MKEHDYPIILSIPKNFIKDNRLLPHLFIKHCLDCDQCTRCGAFKEMKLTGEPFDIESWHLLL